MEKNQEAPDRRIHLCLSPKSGSGSISGATSLFVLCRLVVVRGVSAGRWEEVLLIHTYAACVAILAQFSGHVGARSLRARCRCGFEVYDVAAVASQPGENLCFILDPGIQFTSRSFVLRRQLKRTPKSQLHPGSGPPTRRCLGPGLVERSSPGPGGGPVAALLGQIW